MKNKKTKTDGRIQIYCLCLIVLISGMRSPAADAKQRRGSVRQRPAVNTRTTPKPIGTRTTPAQRRTSVNTVNRSQSNKTINVDRSRNVVIDNSHNNRNTVVIDNRRPYPRPPVIYGGRSFYAFHPYVYHPYHPYAWGPYYHPWGYFIAGLTATAIILSVAGQKYHYDQGVYYAPSNGGYTVVQAPLGAVISTLPSGAEQTTVDGVVNYFYAGAFYVKTQGGYKVVSPTAGAIITKLPDGGVETKVNQLTYVKFGETYYQPIQQDGKSLYEVVLVK